MYTEIDPRVGILGKLVKIWLKINNFKRKKCIRLMLGAYLLFIVKTIFILFIYLFIFKKSFIVKRNFNKSLRK